MGGIKQGNNTKIDSSGYIYIDLTKYTGNAVIDGHLTTSNITILGSSTFLNTDVYITERLEIINDGFNNAVDIKQKISGYDIINASNLTNEVFKIDYNGAITFNESINNINKDQFSKIANITTNDSNVSNYVRITSNVLKSYVDTNDTNVSNYVRITSNILFNDYSDLIANITTTESNWTSNADGITTYSNVAIGNVVATNSAYKLDVTGNVNISGDLYKDGSIFKASNWNSNAANTSVYYLGNVGIGNTNPIYSLDVVGNMYVSGNIRTSDTITSFGDYSDERLKDREGNIENPLDIVGKLRGFYYKPNKTANDLGIKGNKMNKRELGVSAQDVQKILPELIDIAPADISYDAGNNVVSKTGCNYLTVNYEKMIPLLIESIKELNKNINELKKENVELRDLIKSQ